jgi:4-hydroxy-L-threonine phosphate dehydrogenase PdxA
MSKNSKVNVGITMGDPAGIGPEIILKAVGQFRRGPGASPGVKLSVFASRAVLLRTARDLDLMPAYRAIKDLILECAPGVRFRYGKPTRETARAAMASIDRALEPEYGVDVLITPPIVKEAVRALIPDFVGHTEYLAAHYGLDRHQYAMMGLSRDRKRIMLVTTHLPLRNAAAFVTPRNVFKKIMLLDRGLRKYFGVARPEIGVAAFNPHVFEFSRGEDEKILKGVLEARANRVLARGPFSTDTLFTRAYDGFLAMFHDQAFVFLKARKGGLNFTLGLPIVRLSPLHGAALDIAGKNVADHTGMMEALKEGVRIHKNMQRSGDEEKK